MLRTRWGELIEQAISILSVAPIDEYRNIGKKKQTEPENIILDEQEIVWLCVLLQQKFIIWIGFAIRILIELVCLRF